VKWGSGMSSNNETNLVDGERRHRVVGPYDKRRAAKCGTDATTREGGREGDGASQ
jgi:hypothetical protein